jgi:hypothetical protein
MMRQRFLMGLLAFGALGGYLSGFMSLGRHAHARREAYERHMAQMCMDAARGDGANAARRGHQKDE